MADQKQYIGDGVYVANEYGQLVLTTEDGVSVTNRIYLEPNVYAALVRYVERLQQQGSAQAEEEEDERP